MRKVLTLIALTGILLSGCQYGEVENRHYSGNPILPGNFADPCVVVHLDTFYIYATSGREATVWRSPDFRNWKLTKLNWPSSMELPSVWAPAVTRGKDGRFYLYTSTDHNLYAGVSDHPLGPFTNLLGGDSIFIQNRQWWDKMHTIDADCYLDDDGEAYLYWGSGFDFKDGICAVGILDNDMASFREQPELITPDNYFEGPHMLKRDGIYYLTYSDGFFYDSTYKVRYAVSDSPMGPFVEGKNSPILKSTPDGEIIGPGHHYTMKMGEEIYIIYHKHGYPPPVNKRRLIRQVCIDRLEFDTDGSIKLVEATKEGVLLDFAKNDKGDNQVRPALYRSSGTQGVEFSAEKAFDNDFGTIWAADNGPEPCWLEADFGAPIVVTSCSPIFDRVMASYTYRIEYSEEDGNWKLYGEGNNSDADEWPVEIAKEVKARKIRISIDPSDKYDRIGLWEFKIYANQQ
jgi:arabinoxylan arabinofuranohydrolase